jgi:anti-anti-sigma factor
MNLELITDDNRLTRLACAGEISQIRARTTGNPLEELLGPDWPGRTILIDFEKADWIDSSGISWLIVSHRRCRDAGGRLVLCRFPERIRTVLAFCKIDTVLNVAADEAAALALLEKTTG